MLEVPVYATRTIPDAMRQRIVERDGMTCRRCGRVVVRRGPREPYQPDTLHLDHVVHWAAGGPTSEDNLIVSCADCNLRRPKPERIVRQSKVRAEQRGGAYWWPEGYTPPRVSAARRLAPLEQFADAVGMTPAQVLALVGNGHLAASAGGQIKVEMPKAKRAKPTPRGLPCGSTEPAWLVKSRRTA